MKFLIVKQILLVSTLEQYGEQYGEYGYWYQWEKYRSRFDFSRVPESKFRTSREGRIFLQDWNEGSFIKQCLVIELNT